MLNFKHDRIATESWGDEGINRNWLKVMSIDKSKLNCYESEHDPRSWMKNLGGWKWKKKKRKNSGLSRNWTLAVTLYPVSYSSLLETWGPFLESPGNFLGPKSKFKSKYKEEERESWLANYSILFH